MPSGWFSKGLGMERMGVEGVEWRASDGGGGGGQGKVDAMAFELWRRSDSSLHSGSMMNVDESVFPGWPKILAVRLSCLVRSIVSCGPRRPTTKQLQNSSCKQEAINERCISVSVCN